MKRTLLRGTIALALLGIHAAAADACPRCRDAVQSQKQGRLAEGFSYSIYLMIAVPITIAATGTFAVIRAARRGLLPEL